MRRAADPASPRIKIIESLEVHAIQNKTISHAHGGGKQPTKHTIKNVTHDEPHLDGKEWIDWDVDEMVFRVSGNDVFANQRSALGV
jgi:phage tail tube protein FII